MSTRIKICGLRTAADVQAANAAKPDYAGFIVNVPFSHRSVSAEEASLLVRELDPAISAVGVFLNASPEEVTRAARVAHFDVIQLHGGETEQDMERIRVLLGMEPAAEPTIPPTGRVAAQLWKAFKVRSGADVRAARESTADLVLLDGGTGEGRTFNWDLASEIERPFLLAGGLDPENIPEACRTLRPFAVDLSSGVETDKAKDPDKMLRAVQAARKPL